MTRSLDEIKAEERELLEAERELQEQAPNPRDYSTWDAFYEAQEKHAVKLDAVSQRRAELWEEYKGARS